MFLLKPSNCTPKPKTSIREGLPIPAATIPDICILNTQNVYNAQLLNSIMLREALLADRKETEHILGLVVLTKEEYEKLNSSNKKTKKPLVLPKEASKEVDEEATTKVSEEATTKVSEEATTKVKEEN